MDQATAAKPSRDFVFRGNAMASAGHLKVLDGKPVVLTPDTITVHGESSIPGIGGVSHSVIEQPKLLFAPWIQYGRCETRVEGTGDDAAKMTNLLTTSQNVTIITRPSPQDNVPGV